MSPAVRGRGPWSRRQSLRLRRSKAKTMGVKRKPNWTGPAYTSESTARAWQSHDRVSIWFPSTSRTFLSRGTTNFSNDAIYSLNIINLHSSRYLYDKLLLITPTVNRGETEAHIGERRRIGDACRCDDRAFKKEFEGMKRWLKRSRDIRVRGRRDLQGIEEGS